LISPTVENLGKKIGPMVKVGWPNGKKLVGQTVKNWLAQW